MEQTAVKQNDKVVISEEDENVCSWKEELARERKRRRQLEDSVQWLKKAVTWHENQLNNLQTKSAKKQEELYAELTAANLALDEVRQKFEIFETQQSKKAEVDANVQMEIEKLKHELFESRRKAGATAALFEKEHKMVTDLQVAYEAAKTEKAEAELQIAALIEKKNATPVVKRRPLSATAVSLFFKNEDCPETRNVSTESTRPCLRTVSQSFKLHIHECCSLPTVEQGMQADGDVRRSEEEREEERRRLETSLQEFRTKALQLGNINEDLRKELVAEQKRNGELGSHPNLKQKIAHHISLKKENVLQKNEILRLTKLVESLRLTSR